ncbi:PTI1-like tyrosine-protein kinase [Tripterygium wilfordii]|uniref:non-specific serine/threonine protein kinase n=1 Tax=Tripterygium wilfordii TaxID=458696 RepID=A0A7J7D9B2_TRIWF|nr:PTI1-like tyrosine-protein kinase [Tripterygium wilfordii]
MGSAMSCCCSENPDERVNSISALAGNNSWRIFTYKELQTATNGFSEDNKLGEGGFGSVYWGKTSDGLQIAVKKLKAMNSKAEMEFALEVEVLGRVRHKNLLGLRGYCVGSDQRLIVYDYMPNLSLLSHLHGQFAGEVRLDWKKRMKVAIGSAEGILTITEWAEPLIAEGRFKELVDPKLRGNFNEDQLKQGVNVAALCVQSEPEKRPNMKEVVNMLKGYDPRGKEMNLRIRSVKYKEELLALDQATDDDDDDDYVDDYTGVPDESEYGIFSALEVQKMQDPYNRYGDKKMVKHV